MFISEELIAIAVLHRDHPVLLADCGGEAAAAGGVGVAVEIDADGVLTLRGPGAGAHPGEVGAVNRLEQVDLKKRYDYLVG
jgi:hypothetical protein